MRTQSLRESFFKVLPERVFQETCYLPHIARKRVYVTPISIADSSFEPEKSQKNPPTEGEDAICSNLNYFNASI